MTTDLVPIRRALLSVSDKTGLVELGRALASREVELLSTGGTAQALRAAGLPVRDVAAVTDFPEMLDGRVKTLHPMVHAGLLARRDDPDHRASLDEYGIGTIDLLVVNLYPFEATVAAGGDYAACIENIDIGGPAMLRSAAKNHEFVTVVTDVEDYGPLIAEMERTGGATGREFRRACALTAFGRTAAYDAAVSGWLAGALGEATPRRRSFAGTLAQPLRYGENPHQGAAFYRDGSARPGVATARQLQGKALSYNNINDTDAAFELVAEFAGEGAACAIIKHANPCGVAKGGSMVEAYRAAYDCDRTSAFGGIVALNGRLDAETAAAIAEIFTEVVIAPEVDEAAAEVFAAKKNLRLLVTGGLPDARAAGLAWRQVAGGFLVQGRDSGHLGRGDLRTVSQAGADGGGDGGPAVRLDGGQACEIKRDCLRAGRGDRGHRGRADEPGGLHPHRGAEGAGHGRGAGAGRGADPGGGGGVGCVLSVRRRASGGRGGGGDGGDSAGRIGPRRRSHRCGRRGGIGDGLHCDAAF